MLPSTIWTTKSLRWFRGSSYLQPTPFWYLLNARCNELLDRNSTLSCD